MSTSEAADKTYPDKTLTAAARARGLSWQCLWEIPGPRNTLIAWMSCYLIGAGTVIVQTFHGGGWEVYSALDTNDCKASIDDALARCAPAQAVAS